MQRLHDAAAAVGEHGVAGGRRWHSQMHNSIVQAASRGKQQAASRALTREDLPELAGRQRQCKSPLPKVQGATVVGHSQDLRRAAATHCVDGSRRHTVGSDAIFTQL